MKLTRMTWLAAVLCVAQAGWGRVTLPNHFTDNMVVQQKTTLKIRGTANAGSTVTLKTGWNKKGVSTTAAADGKFLLTIETPKAGGPYELIFNDGEETTLKNVLVGEVWLGSGQSNMEMPLAGWGKILNYEEEIKNANYPKIRLLQVKKVTNIKPQEQVQLNMGGWQECSPEHIANFSALCYFYALNLWEELKVPIGVIDDDWGGTTAESWVSAEALKGVQGLEKLASQIIKDNYDGEKITKWIDEDYAKRLQAAPEGQKPGKPLPITHQNHASVLYNAMIHPLIEFPIRGVIWYQGCSNVGRHRQHQSLFQTLIKDWRARFNNPDMPFYFVQLANYLEPKDVQPRSAWALLRESQADALCLPNTGMAVNIDLGDAKDIHPKTKRELGRRLSAIALNQTYGKKVPYTAPIYRDYTVEGKTMRIKMDMPQGAESLVQDDNLPGFIMAGPDGKWHKATGKTCGKSEVIVSSPAVKQPVAVRYGWADNPTCTLHTKSGLYVAPFRTDNW